MSAATTPTPAGDALALDERDLEPRTPMKRLGSTRKLAAFNNIRMQLQEQSRVLEGRAEAAAGVAGELHEYCRRRADLEHEYARALDKLARAAHQRHKDQRHKREHWPLTGAYACWQAALDNTRALSRDHAALADLYGGPLAARLQRAADDVLRLHRKCRDIVSERHEEVGAALAEAAAGGKAAAAAAAEWRAAALKLRHAHDQRARLAAADPPRHKKLKQLDKELDKRRSRHSEARARALRARADYVLSLEAANATLQRYYLDDIADIMLCSEVGFEAVVGRCVRTAAEAESARAAAAGAAGGALRAAGAALDALADRQRLVAAHAAAFAPPRPLPYRGAAPALLDAELRALVGDAADERDAGSAAVAADLRTRLAHLDAAARRLRAECHESAKTLDAAEAELVRQMEGGDAAWDVSSLFGRKEESTTGSTTGSTSTGVLALTAADEQEAPRRDQEDYYLAKFRAYVSCAGRLARLESKAAAARTRLLGGADADADGGLAGAGAECASPPSPPRRAAARLRRGQFAAPLDHRLPTVLTSCVRVIATYGLRHQGIFRVSGSQVEMQALRAAFERGEDPLARVRDASDMNSVCGLLKLYLRELRPPLLPPHLQERLVRVAGAADDAEFVRRMRDTVQTLAAPALLVLRYLFAFLAHLTQHSDRTMMDAWNLAVCVGPTLLAAWGEGGAQVANQNLVNDLVKRTIIHHLEVFPQNVAPHALYDPAQFVEANSGGSDGDSGEGTDASETRADGDADQDADHADGRDEHDAHDVNDDLSLLDDDDDDDDELSDDADADWHEREQEHARSGSAERHAAHAQERNGAASSTVAAVAPPPCRRLAESTPDLVLDLPARAVQSAGHAGHAGHGGPGHAGHAGHGTHAAAATPPADSADTFAHNRDTLKKRPTHKQSRSEGSAERQAEGGVGARGDSEAEAESGAGAEAEAEAQGSPVPARNTARVAAKFADLTLTGGSLKPALAAKPALLRRPTPHPHARPPATPATPAAAAPAAPLAPPRDPAC